VRYYLSTANRAWTIPKADLIRELGTKDCEFCTRTVDAAVYLEEHGERFAGDPVSEVVIEAFGGAPAGEQYLAVEFKQNAVDVLDAQGQISRSDPAAQVKANAAVRWSSGGWLLAGVEAG
jgi:hypothetical protein